MRGDGIVLPYGMESDSDPEIYERLVLRPYVRLALIDCWRVCLGLINGESELEIFASRSDGLVRVHCSDMGQCTGDMIESGISCLTPSNYERESRASRIYVRNFPRHFTFPWQRSSRALSVLPGFGVTEVEVAFP